MALQEFQLGYLHEKYAGKLCDPETFEYCKAAEDNYAAKRKTNDHNEGYDLAIRHFNNAFDHFKKIDHYLGMMLSKKHVSRMYDDYVNHLLDGRKKSDDKTEKSKLEAR